MRTGSKRGTYILCVAPRLLWAGRVSWSLEHLREVYLLGMIPFGCGQVVFFGRLVFSFCRRIRVGRPYVCFVVSLLSTVNLFCVGLVSCSGRRVRCVGMTLLDLGV